MPGREGGGNHLDALRVGSRSPRNCFQIQLVGEVEEKYVVSLPVDGVRYRVRLVCDEQREQPEVSHSCYEIIPVGVVQVKMGLFGHQEEWRYQGPC